MLYKNESIELVDPEGQGFDKEEEEIG